MRHWVHEPSTDCDVADIAFELLTAIKERSSGAAELAVDDVAEHIHFLLASTSAVSATHLDAQCHHGPHGVTLHAACTPSGRLAPES